MEAVKSAEINRTHFWPMLKYSCRGDRNESTLIKDPSGKVVCDLHNVVEVHFSGLGTPRTLSCFDSEHFEHFNSFVFEKSKHEQIDPFTQESVTCAEVIEALPRLKKGKVSGLDGITHEHTSIINAGPHLIRVLVVLYNQIIRTEYIHLVFRRGIQIPLYKGRNSDALLTDNYRGITL